jgi:hypothetical protein
MPSDSLPSPEIMSSVTKVTSSSPFKAASASSPTRQVCCVTEKLRERRDHSYTNHQLLNRRRR